VPGGVLDIPERNTFHSLQVDAMRGGGDTIL
jgi:hypothetical protein